ncbi:MAG: polyprenol monophosphomannose synthase [Candidatus Omnitrophica bacterium]|nr:polyprenol monophosphomannose synthase [Candidatus Omnitrophota bacterium]
MEARKTRTAVVIPTYNEKDNIKKITAAIFGVLPQAHIVIVDDASGDGTGAIAERLKDKNARIHVIHRKGERGLGLAYIDGFKFVLEHLDSDYIFEMDADLSHDPRHLPEFLHYARDYDMVTGSRFINGGTVQKRSLWRATISRIARWSVNILTGMELTDVTTGFKCFQRPLLEAIDLDEIRSKGYAFQIELSRIAKDRGSSIKEMPIIFTERRAGHSKMSAQIILEAVFLVFRIITQKLLNRGA